MNLDKYVMLKANIKSFNGIVSIGSIKNRFDVESKDAEEMLQNLIQEGIVEPYSTDGTNFKVK